MKKIFVLFISLLALGAYSQTTPKAFVKKAEKELNKSYPDYNVAISHLDEAKKLDPEQIDIDFLLALCYLQTPNTHRALPYLNTVINSGQEYNDELDFFKAYIHHLDGDFNIAIASYNKYLDRLSEEDKKSKNILSVAYYLLTSIRQGHTFDVVPYKGIDKVVENRIKQCESGSHLVKNELYIEIENLGFDINSEYDEYAPVYSAIDTTLYFTSRRPIPNHLKKESSDELYLEHIFEADKKSGEWSDATFEEEPLNSFTHNVSALMISNDGTDMFIFDHRHHGDIMHSVRRSNGKWINPVPFDEAFNSSNIERSFTIDDNKTIAFLERDDEDEGDRDLFYSINEGGKWSEPKNAGDVLNTEFNEDGVFLSPNGKVLYFCSDRYNSMGGYDIFKSEWKDTTWSEPINMGYPINSTYDDIFFIMSRDEKMAFFSSNRPGGHGGYDIFFADLDPDPKNQLIYCKVKDDESGSFHKDAKVILTNKTTGETYPMVFNSSTNRYEISIPNVENETKFAVSVSKKKYISSERQVDIADELESFDAGEISLKGIPVEVTKFIFNDTYLFDVNSSKFFKKYHDRLATLIEAMKTYDVTIQIDGHTDNSGTTDSNQLLSETRAQSVKDYLVSKGVSASKIITKGYGETKPVEGNTNANKKEKKLNRRVEVSLVD